MKLELDIVIGPQRTVRSSEAFGSALSLTRYDETPDPLAPVYRMTGRPQRRKYRKMPTKTEAFIQAGQRFVAQSCCRFGRRGRRQQGSNEMAARDDQSVSIGRIFSRAFAVMGNNPLVIFGVALVLGAGPQLLYSMLIGTNLATAAAEGGDAIRAAAIGAIAFGFVSMVSRSLVSGCITRATVAYSQGHRASLGECLSVALRRAVPVIVVSILFGIAVVLGMILLIVPGIMLAVMWSVVVPITVEERTGILGAFGRAQDLTRGARWTIFGLFLLIFVIGLGIGLIGILISTVTIGLSYQNPAISSSLPAIIMNAVVLTLASALSSTLVTSLFVELRNWKDGPEDSKLSDIFA